MYSADNASANASNNLSGTWRWNAAPAGFGNAQFGVCVRVS
jgi:hypothetical protein